MKGSLAKEFGSIIGGGSKEGDEGGSGAGQDILDAIKDGDAKALKLAVKLLVEECMAEYEEGEDEDTEED